MRRLYLVLGDQLDLNTVLDEMFDPAQDALWMAESEHEARRTWSHKARIVYFISAMRHFREHVRARGLPLHYRQADHSNPAASLAELLREAIQRLKPQQVVMVRPGDWHVRETLSACIEDSGVECIEREDPHFLTTPQDFAAWAQGRKSLRMEFFYREQRRAYQYLIDADGQPEGGRWNFDADNRAAFGADGPGWLPTPQTFEPDQLTREVISEIDQHYADHPGSTAAFDWPVTRKQALQALDDFVDHRLASFGQYQDAMWLGEPYLYHSRLSAALNLHLLNPREVIEAAIQSPARYQSLAAVEGFVRQILGWREFVRGLYWLRMPAWLEENALDAQHPLPAFYWTGETPMACLADALKQTLDYGYAHHIQRLMVTGLYALLLGVRPTEIHAWYHAIYVDAVEWVELPNTLGMSQFVDGGVLASKPYVASGAYISRMSNACERCRFNPKQAVGEQACPVTTLYWDFLDRHQQRFASHPRMRMQVRNLERKSEDEMAAIRQQARRIRGEA